MGPKSKNSSRLGTFSRLFQSMIWKDSFLSAYWQKPWRMTCKSIWNLLYYFNVSADICAFAV